MALLVKKFGGTSVGDIQKIQKIATSICKSKEEGNEIVVVVSAMGKTTDVLNCLAESISKNPNRRELDMLLSTGEQVTIALLSMALNEYGIPAISMTGSQVGIITESIHGKARILDIKTERIQNYLNQGFVVVVAGFQGTTLSHTGSMEITTLGRGGSDTSAVALSTALGAETCEIYTDVPGVLTTDPRIVPNAKLLDEISCEEMLELASVGASVLHPRAVEIARNYGIKLCVKSSQSDSSGTLLESQIQALPLKRGSLELTKTVNSLEVLENQAVFSLSNIPDRPGIAAQIFEKLSEASINAPIYDELFKILFIIGLIIFIGMTIAVIYSLFKFRKRNDQIGDGIALEGNLSLEIIWTIIPSIIVLLIGLYSYNIYDRMGGMKELNHNHEMMSSNSEKIWAGISQTSENEISKNNLSIEVSAMQFAFLFNYPKGNFISGELHVPVDQKISMKMESKDVIHAFWVPEFRIKQDIIPGQPTILNFTPTKVGKYPIICAELCGPYHGGMRASIIVEDESDYNEWFNKNKKPEVNL